MTQKMVRREPATESLECSGKVPIGPRAVGAERGGEGRRKPGATAENWLLGKLLPGAGRLEVDCSPGRSWLTAELVHQIADCQGIISQGVSQVTSLLALFRITKQCC